MSEPCVCHGPGMCPKLGRNMSNHLVTLCRTRDDYRDLFEKQARDAGTFTAQSLPVIELPSCGHRGGSIGFQSTPFGTSELYQCRIHKEASAQRCMNCPERGEVPVITSIDGYLPIQGKGPRPLKWAVGMVTAPRQRPTFDKSIRSMIAAGWNEPRIFAEPGSPIADDLKHLPITQRTDAAGCWANHYLALQELLIRNPDADTFMLSQDDVVFTQGDKSQTLRQYLDRALWPTDDGAAVSIYCSALYAKEDYGWHLYGPGEWLWGALVFIWQRAALAHFLATTAQQWTLRGENKRVDVAYARWHTQNNLKVAYCYPSLVQHIGDTSTIFGPGNRAIGRRAARDYVQNML